MWRHSRPSSAACILHRQQGARDVADRVRSRPAEKLELPEQLSQALNTKALILLSIGRRHEAGALLRQALQLALDHELSAAALRAYNNLMAYFEHLDRYDEALDLNATALELARRTGDKSWESLLLGSSVVTLFLAGRWDEVLERAEEIGQFSGTYDTCLGAIIAVHQGDLDRARGLIDAASELADTDEVQARGLYWCCLAGVQLAEGDSFEALASAESAIEIVVSLPTMWIANKIGFDEAIEAALDLGDDAKAEETPEEDRRPSPGRDVSLPRRSGHPLPRPHRLEERRHRCRQPLPRRHDPVPAPWCVLAGGHVARAW